MKPRNNNFYIITHRYTIILILLAIILGCISLGCNRADRKAKPLLQMADKIMSANPDSALRIINSIDTIGLSDDVSAHYSLLITKAMHKNYLPLTNDTLILKAVNHYTGRGDSLETQALYYSGETAFELDKIPESFAAFHLSLDNAEDNVDHFYEALSARALSDLYKNNGDFNKQFTYALKAKKAFIKNEEEKKDTSKLKPSSWMNIMIEQAYINLNQPENALQLCALPDSNWYIADSYYRHRTLINKAYAYHLLKNYDSAIACYNELKADGYEFRGYDYCCLAHNYFNIGRNNAAIQSMDSAKTRLVTVQDSLYYNILTGWNERICGNTDNALNILDSLQRRLQIESLKIIKSQDTTKLIESYRIISRKNKEKSNNFIFKIIILTALCLCLLITLIISIKKRKDRDDKVSQLLKLLDSLNAKFTSLNAQNHEIENNYEYLYNGVEKYITMIRKDLNNLCHLWIHIPERNKDFSNLSKQMSRFIETIISAESGKTVKYIIDIYCTDVINLINESGIKLTANQICLIKYLYVGFSKEAIMILLNKSTMNALNIEQSRLKKTLIENKDKGGEIIYSRIFPNR